MSLLLRLSRVDGAILLGDCIGESGFGDGPDMQRGHPNELGIGQRTQLSPAGSGFSTPCTAYYEMDKAEAVLVLAIRRLSCVESLTNVIFCVA